MGHRKSWLSALVQQYKRLRQAIAEAPPVAAIPAILFGIAAGAIYGVGELILASIHTDPAVRTIIKITVDVIAGGIGLCCLLFLGLGIGLGAQKLTSEWKHVHRTQTLADAKHRDQLAAQELETQRKRTITAQLKTAEKREKLLQKEQRIQSRNSRKLHNSWTRRLLAFLRRMPPTEVGDLVRSPNNMQQLLSPPRTQRDIVEVEATHRISEDSRIIDAD